MIKLSPSIKIWLLRIFLGSICMSLLIGVNDTHVVFIYPFTLALGVFLFSFFYNPYKSEK
jgi:hypothetical protein